MTCIKLCGIKRLADIEKVNELRPEYIGFVFWEKSKRNVTKDQAKELKGRLREGNKTVGVFVDPEPEFAADLVNDGVIDIIQLHGNEDEAYIQKLRELTDAEIIKAFQFCEDSEKNDLIVKAVNDSSADYVLLDAGKGCGNTFDWGITERVNKRFFLAGGLDPENVAAAIEKTRPYAVDVSSGIETDGVKDPAKMERFVNNVRAM